jgi:hypothetical protein
MVFYSEDIEQFIVPYSVQLTPDKANKNLTISFMGDVVFGQINISDSTGNNLYNGIFDQQSVVVSILNYKPGTYNVEISANTGKLFRTFTVLD